MIKKRGIIESSLVYYIIGAVTLVVVIAISIVLKDKGENWLNFIKGIFGG